MASRAAENQRQDVAMKTFSAMGAGNAYAAKYWNQCIICASTKFDIFKGVCSPVEGIGCSVRRDFKRAFCFFAYNQNPICGQVFFYMNRVRNGDFA